MTTVLQYFRDTVSPEKMAIDDSYQGVLAYANGRYAWPQDQVNRFVSHGKHLYRIDVNSSIPHGASILDVERFDATPAMAAGWVPRRNAFRGDAGCYTSRDNVPALVDAVGTKEHCWLIVADWTGEPHLPGLDLPPNFRVAMVQYANLPGWDLGAVYSADWLAGRHIK